MAGKPQDLEFLQAFSEPIADCGSSKIMELAFFDTCLTQNLVEAVTETGDHLRNGIRIRLFAFGTKLLLDVIVSDWWYKNIRMTFGLPILVIDQKLREHIGQR